MFGYLFALIMGVVCGMSVLYMDLDAESDFFRLFLPFLSVVTGFGCFVIVVLWVFWKCGYPASGHSSPGWFAPGGSPSSEWWGSSSERPTSAASDDGASGGDAP